MAFVVRKALFAFFLVGGSGLKIKEEMSGETHRFITMTELEEKSAFYLKHIKGIGDEEELKLKVEIMCDRFQELYQARGLDAIHDIFEDTKNLEVTLGREAEWQDYLEKLSNPTESDDWNYAPHAKATFVASVIISSLLLTPYTVRYIRKSIGISQRDKNDTEWKGAESTANVLVRRKKRRTGRIIYKPMLPRFDLKTESQNTTEEKLKLARANMLSRVKKEEAIAMMKRDKWESILEGSGRWVRGGKLSEVYEDIDEDESDNYERYPEETASKCSYTVIVNLKGIRNCWDGDVHLKNVGRKKPRSSQKP